jgi:ABC-type multidrug transport system permease subunit
VISYFLIGFQCDFTIFYATVYALAMASTALGVMLGSAVENPKLGQEFLPVLFVPQMLFAGFFVAPNLIPVWLRWARFICTMTYALRIIMVAEFDRDCGSVRGNENCQDLLEVIDADPDETWWNWIVLVSLFVVFRFTALAILQKKGSKFY